MKYIFSLLLLLLTSFGAKAQESPEKTKSQIRKEQRAQKKAEELKEAQRLVETGCFTFVAERMLSSMPRGNRNLNSYYFLEISKDKIVCLLPFYGKMNNVDINNSNPFEFESSDFSIDEIKYNDKSVEITYDIDPEDGNNHYKILMEVFSLESVSINVIQNQGDAILFSGYIEPTKNKTK